MYKENPKKYNDKLDIVLFLLIFGFSSVLNTIGSIRDLKLALELSSFKNNAVQTEAKVTSIKEIKTSGRRGTSTHTIVSYKFKDIYGINNSASYKFRSRSCLPVQPSFLIVYSKLNPQVNHIGSIFDISTYIQMLVFWGCGLIVLACLVSYGFFWYEKVWCVPTNFINDRNKRIHDFVSFLAVTFFIVNAILIAIGFLRALSEVKQVPINLTQQCFEPFPPQQ